MSYFDTEDAVKKCIRLIKSACSVHNYALAFSGGKDSVVLSYLCKEAGVKLPHFYNLTTIDPKGTTDFCLKHGCTILRPQKTFLQLVEQKGMPTQFRRFCCQYLKEQYIAPYLMTGVRRAESVRRTKRYCSFEMVHKYNSKLSSLKLMPILFLDDENIEYIVNSRQLECHSLYYDNGRFCVERRLGCQGCPLQGNRGRDDYKANPRLFVAVTKRLIRFHLTHGRTEHDAYLNLVYNLFYSNHKHQYFLQTYKGLFYNDPKSFLESYFSVKLP